MGSFDQMPEDYDGPPPQHAIQCNSKWSARSDRHEHASVEEVRVCFEAAIDEAKGMQVGPCSWLLEGRYDDGSKFSYPCEAPTRYTDERGSYECTARHSHVPADVRQEQGWDYADEDEAAGLMRNGVRPVRMDGTGF